MPQRLSRLIVRSASLGRHSLDINFIGRTIKMSLSRLSSNLEKFVYPSFSGCSSKTRTERDDINIMSTLNADQGNELHSETHTDNYCCYWHWIKPKYWFFVWCLSGFSPFNLFENEITKDEEESHRVCSSSHIKVPNSSPPDLGDSRPPLVPTLHAHM